MSSSTEVPGDEAGGGQVSVHQPVLVAEALAALAPGPGQVLVDGTVGAGGHASRALSALVPGGLLVGIDKDAAVLAHARRALEQGVSKLGGGVALRLYQASYSRMQEVLRQEGLAHCDRVLLDLGVSSLQLDTAARGFSFSKEGPLDMRMDQSDASTPTAAQWLARVAESELARVLYEYGEERQSRRIARAIVAARRERPLQTTGELADLIRGVIGAPPGSRIHPATRSFQAIRIHVNDELGDLERGLRAAHACLRPGGRLAVITFHSLEDRIVKLFMREHFELVLRKPVEASAAEVTANPRARSAKLRCGIRTEAA